MNSPPVSGVGHHRDDVFVGIVAPGCSVPGEHVHQAGERIGIFVDLVLCRHSVTRRFIAGET